MEVEDSDSASVEYDFETQPGSVGFMVLASQSESQAKNTEEVDVLQMWPALQPREEQKEENQSEKSGRQCLTAVMNRSLEENNPTEAVQVLATETELSESELEPEVTVIEKPGERYIGSPHSQARDEKQTPSSDGKAAALFRSMSPQDMFDNEDEEREICTPAGFVGSLHLSNQAMLVPETTDSECPLPSTPEELEGLPKIIPSSPTDGSFIVDESMPVHYDPREDSTLADEITVIQKSRKLDPPELSQKKPQSSEEREDEGKQRVESESAEYNPKRESTLAGRSDDEPSLHLHYSETQGSTHRQEQKGDSVEFIGTEFLDMDVISIKSTDATEIDEVPESQEELSLRLTPSQSDKSGRETTDTEVVPQQNRERLPLVKSQDLVTERTSLQKRQTYLSQPTEWDRMAGTDWRRLRTVESRDEDGAGMAESENFALSLPKDGELLHPCNVSPEKSPKSGINSQASEKSIKKARQTTSTALVERYKEPHTRSRTQEGQHVFDSLEPGPSGLNLHCSSEDTPPQAPVTTESQVSNRSFMLQRPDAQSEATRESEDTQQNIFRRSVSAKDSPRKRVIEEDSDDEVTIVQKSRKTQSSHQHKSDEDISFKENHSQSRQPSTPKAITMEHSSQLTDKGTSGMTALRKIPSLSSEGSQSRVSLHKKTSVSTEGGYQASVEDEQSVSHFPEPEAVVRSHEPEPLTAIPVDIFESGGTGAVRDPEPETIEVTIGQRRRTAKPIMHTPVSGKKRKRLTKLKIGNRLEKCSPPKTTETPNLLKTPTLITTTASSTSSEETSQMNTAKPSLLTERSTIILSPPLARASSLESVLSRPPLMSTSETPTNRPTKARSSRTEPRFKIPMRTDLEKSLNIEQQLTASEAFERKTIIVKIKQFEVRTEITEVIQQGKVLSKSEKEISKEPVTVKVKTYQEIETLSPSSLSPSRTISSLTSGDLGDISSSMSRSGSSNVPSSLSEHDIPSRQPSVNSLEASSMEVISPAQDLPGPSERNVAPLTTVTPSIPASAPASDSFTPNVSAGFVVNSPSGSRELVADKPTTSTGYAGEVREDDVPKSGSSGEISSDIPFQDEQNITATTESTGVGLIRTEPVKGSRIMAKWKDGYFYPGTILKLDPSRYQVKFDDGDSRYVRQSEVLLIERLPLGQPVMVQSQDGFFDAGLIIGQTKRGGVLQYSVEKDSGQNRLFHSSQVILSVDQANLLLSDLPTTSPQRAAAVIEPNPSNVSLDNLVDGKRRVGSRYMQSDWHAESSSASPVKSKTHRPAADQPVEPDKPSLSRGVRRKIPPLPQQATSTPTPKEKKRGTRKAVDPESTPTYPDVSVAVSPIEPRRSPRKTRQGLFEKQKQSSNALPFRGLVFLLTYVEKSKDLKEEEKSLLKNPYLTSDESSAENPDDAAPQFDKQDITRRIQTGGGTVLEKFDEAAIANAKQCFLISNSYQRTIKYFQCLAAAIPCVSHLWIRDSSNQGVLLDYKAYKLQAGVSIEKRKIMEWSYRKGDLQGFSVYVSSSHKKFLEEWSFILKLAGCHVLQKLPAVNSDTPVNVIVTDLTCPKTVVRRSLKSGIPLVASEWVMQCLINGKRLSFTGHPRYSYDFNS
ncbi:TP53-binding protein 1-like isoform X3 [Ostrea edulis]|uniref:TP53-binding protein 1-like isoform X3 n=1 Tax=Ostrea edulis TaxID=37623 RepID=UPI0024AFF395|nr:TP53-binding protein 1-like isoform X3 [Ostrea edulis]XP_056021603.1 TP53-binding protein 1-like isoform X3 [Ostrea edulis]